MPVVVVGVLKVDKPDLVTSDGAIVPGILDIHTGDGHLMEEPVGLNE